MLLLVGSSGEEEHWSLCVADTESVLSFAVGAMFVRQEFDGNSKHSVSAIQNYKYRYRLIYIIGY